MGCFVSREQALNLLSESGEPGLPDSEIVTVAWPFPDAEKGEQIFRGGGSSRAFLKSTTFPISDSSVPESQSFLRTQETTACQNKTEIQTVNKITTIIRISAHAVKITAEHEILFLRQKGIRSYYLYEPQSSSPYWVCFGSFENTPAAAEQIKLLQNRVARQYEIINVPASKLKNIRS